jgi:hypothetical protein
MRPQNSGDEEATCLEGLDAGGACLQRRCRDAGAGEWHVRADDEQGAWGAHKRRGRLARTDDRLRPQGRGVLSWAMSAPKDANGTAGASARREQQRRQDNRETRVRKRHPRLGGLILALQDAPQHETSWGRGAGGEELVARTLAKRCPQIQVLHDRRIPGSRANIDHIAITATGVWVIDTKRYKGKVRVQKPLFGTPTLNVAGRDKTKLVDGLAKQVQLVTAALAGLAPDAPIHGCFCFIDSDLPLLGARSIDGLRIVGRKGLVKQLTAAGPLTVDDTTTLATMLTERFPVA